MTPIKGWIVLLLMLCRLQLHSAVVSTGCIFLCCETLTKMPTFSRREELQTAERLTILSALIQIKLKRGHEDTRRLKRECEKWTA